MFVDCLALFEYLMLLYFTNVPTKSTPWGGNRIVGIDIADYISITLIPENGIMSVFFCLRLDEINTAILCYYTTMMGAIDIIQVFNIIKCL